MTEAREQLRRLGYLDSRLDRFVLAGGGARAPLRACAGVALRVGAAAGLMLGSALAIAAGGLERRLLAEPCDLVVVALSLALVIGALAATGAFALGMLTAWAARRGGSPGAALPRNAGLVFAMTGFAYLALWWRAHAASAPAFAQVAAPVLGLGLALVLARFGSLVAVAALAARGAELPAARRSRRHVLRLLSGAAVLLSVALAASVRGERSARAPDFEVVRTGLQMRVLAIDGLESHMAEQLVARGEMPNLQALLASGARARLRAEPERAPAIVWTTVATGRGPEAHGIRATRARRQGPLARLGEAADLLSLTRREPRSSVLRSVKTFWNVASDKGLRVGVVNWRATWPCEPVGGYVVTDRTLLRIERGGATDREACPPEVFERLVDLRPPTTDRARALDLFYSAAANRLRAAAATDIEAVYLPGLDIATMQLLDQDPAALAGLDQRLEAVRAHYRFVDERIGELRGKPRPGEVLVLVADPGRLARRGRTPATGLLSIVGAPVAPGDMGLVSERDVAPTVLHLAGLPVSRELSGRVLEAGLREDWRRAHPIRFVDAYGRRAAAARSSDFDAELVEELRSLGYVP
jgi:hypothetical protein